MGKDVQVNAYEQAPPGDAIAGGRSSSNSIFSLAKLPERLFRTRRNSIPIPISIKSW